MADPTSDAIAERDREAQYDRREAELKAAIAAQQARVREALIAYQAEYRVLDGLQKTLYYLPVTDGAGVQ